MNVAGFFREFEITHHFAMHQAERLYFRIRRGFSGFEDEIGMMTKGWSRPFLRHLSRRERKRLWRELQAECHRRAQQTINDMTGTVKCTD